MLLENLQQTQKQVKTSVYEEAAQKQCSYQLIEMPASSRRKHVTCYPNICPIFHLECIVSCKGFGKHM